MADLNRAQLLLDLENEEGLRTTLYDDYNAKPLAKGSTILGNPTLGIGWNVAATPLTPDQYRIILGWIVDAKLSALVPALPWVADLSEPRRRAMSDLAFQLGVTGLLKFNTFLSLMASGQFDEAADDLALTAYFRQVGKRGPHIQGLIRGTPT